MEGIAVGGSAIIRGATALTATVLAANSGTAFAQSAPTDRVTELSVNFDVRHDSNVARTDAARAASRGLSLSDERATPSVSLRFGRPIGRHSVELDANVGYDFYRRNKQLNRERLSLAGTANLVGGPCDLTLEPSISRRQSDLADLALLTGTGTGTGTDTVKNTETVQRYAAELRCGRQYGLRPLATIERAIGDNSEPRRQISDYRSFRYGAGVGYTNPVLGDFSARYQHGETSYPKRPAALQSSGYSLDRFSVTAKRDIGAILTASGMLAYLKLRPDQGTSSDFSGVAWDLQLTATPTPDFRVTGSMSRDTSPSLGTDALYQLSRDYSLGASYAVSRVLSVSILGSIDKRDYVGATGFYGPALTNSVQRTVTGTVAFKPSRRIGFAVDVGYQSRNANGVIYDYDNFFAALRTKLTL